MAAEFADLCERSIGAGARAKVLLRRADPTAYIGTNVHVGGSTQLNFGSCSYLGLEVREELKRGTIAAVRRYGTQFPFAKPQLECALYGELEAALATMTGGLPVIASSATMGHLAAVPALMGPGDAVVMDRLAHASLFMATSLLKHSTPEVLPHNRMDALALRIAELSKTHDRVWYILDGVYSMSGAFAPMDQIGVLMDRFPKLHLYADDAHCTSWEGRHGRGHTLEHLAVEHRPRAVVTLSLNKAFSAGGGALITHSEPLRERIRLAGAALMFSGPLQPPMLGAAVASAKLHLTPELSALQATLRDRIALVHRLAEEHGIRLGTTDHTPIAFVPCGPDDAMFELFHRLGAAGFYVAPAVFPAVPQNKAGLRLTVSLHNDVEDTVRLMKTMRAEMDKIPAIVAYQASL